MAIVVSRGLLLGRISRVNGYGSLGSYPLENSTSPSSTCVWNGYSYTCLQLPEATVATPISDQCATPRQRGESKPNPKLGLDDKVEARYALSMRERGDHRATMRGSAVVPALPA